MPATSVGRFSLAATLSPPSTLGPRTEAVFTKIGMLYYDTDISSHPGQNGLTVTDKRAFYNTLRLNGGHGT